ncbi:MULTISPECIES: alpha/beta fold hydrolase [Streptomyces]|uniref:Proline iminopeptidase n=1 Tax=Streptomyces viridochromogenes TaxID=1938 RepID=A0A0L8L0X6_STRVR|nr:MULTISPECIES: alpha/beta hydrolase [Streptomyces]KOG31731.1 proline iminopeptidase [Streptomyces viridochromogenes]
MIATIVATSAAALLAAPTAGLLGHRALRRSRNASLMKIGTPNGIDEQGFVPIGGIDQWISVRGEDLANPVVLELHGGPGASTAIFGPRTRSWEKHFTIVRWDMRGSLKTFGRGGPEGQGEMTFDRIYADAIEVTDHIRTRLGVDKVVLLGHSYGSAFGLRLAREFPERYSAYVGTDQNIHDAGRDDSVHRALLGRLRTTGKLKELAAVEALDPDGHQWTARERAMHAKLLATSDPLTLDTMKKVVMGSLWLSPLHSLRELGSFLKGMTFSERITAGTSGFDDWADGTEFEIPFFLFQGEKDVLTSPELARRFFDDVQAPTKGFALIEDCSHFAAFRRPERFLGLLLAHVRPVIAGRSDAAAGI